MYLGVVRSARWRPGCASPGAPAAPSELEGAVPKEIELALAAWRYAVARRDNATDGNRETLEEDVERAREKFRALSARYVEERIDGLYEEEDRRRSGVPSADIWAAARMSDEGTPASTAADTGMAR